VQSKGKPKNFDHCRSSCSRYFRNRIPPTLCILNAVVHAIWSLLSSFKRYWADIGEDKSNVSPQLVNGLFSSNSEISKRFIIRGIKNGPKTNQRKLRIYVPQPPNFPFRETLVSHMRPVFCQMSWNDRNGSRSLQLSGWSSGGEGERGGEAEREGGNCITITALMFSDMINIYIKCTRVSRLTLSSMSFPHCDAGSYSE